jgi:hypothetical protein
MIDLRRQRISPLRMILKMWRAGRRRRGYGRDTLSVVSGLAEKGLKRPATGPSRGAGCRC